MYDQRLVHEQCPLSWCSICLALQTRNYILMVTLRRRPRLGGARKDEFGGPIPGQQLSEFRLRRVGDSGENVGEPSLWVDVVELGGLDERVCQVPSWNENMNCFSDLAINSESETLPSAWASSPFFGRTANAPEFDAERATPAG